MSIAFETYYTKTVSLWNLVISARLYHSSQCYAARRGLHALALIESRVRKGIYLVEPHLASGKERTSFHSLPVEVREQIVHALTEIPSKEIEAARKRADCAPSEKHCYFDSEGEDTWEVHPHRSTEVLVDAFLSLFDVLFGRKIDPFGDEIYGCDCNFPVSSFL